MPYKISCELLNHYYRVGTTTVEIETASEAWVHVNALMASNDRVTIVDPDGHTIGWQELKEIADKEPN
jgi:hypothetical protein